MTCNQKLQGQRNPKEPEEEGHQREPSATQRQHKQEGGVSSCPISSRPANYFPKLPWSWRSLSAFLILTTQVDLICMPHLRGLLQGKANWKGARLQPTRGSTALFITLPEPSWGSTAVTWPLTPLSENGPHVGAFPFHQDVFLDVQPKHSHFLFLPISLSSGPRYYWLIEALSP